ncbi:O-antigen ligase family protein [Pseudodesulfovibrio methanolicus]|uniref:O-antigen ligase family protein n=1 Tax=Pseudodesulfovibrio methanolicus TaxID=3126690 RepID=A0ABZ2IUC2_9BACT
MRTFITFVIPLIYLVFSHVTRTYALLSAPVLPAVIGLAVIAGGAYFGYRKQLPLRALFTFLGIAMILAGEHSWSVRNQVFEYGLNGFCLFLLLFHQLRGSKERPLNPIKYSLLAFILLAVSSLLLFPFDSISDQWSISGQLRFFQTIYQSPIDVAIQYSMAACNRLFLFFVFIWLITGMESPRECYKALFRGVVIGLIICVLFSIGDIVRSLFFSESKQAAGRFSSIFLNPGWFAQFVIVALPYLIERMQTPVRWKKWLVFVVLVGAELALIFTLSRASWLAYPIILFCCWLIFYSYDFTERQFYFSRKKLLLVCISFPLTICLSVCLVYGLKSIAPSKRVKNSVDYIEKRLERFSKTERPTIWKAGLTIGGEAPVFGLGYETFREHTKKMFELPQSDLSKAFTPFVLRDTAHNTYIQLFTGLGMAGLGIWLMVMALTLAMLVWDAVRNGEMLSLSAALSIVTFHIYGLFQSMQYISIVLLLGMLAVGYAMTLDREVVGDRLWKTAKGWGMACLIVAVLGAGNYALDHGYASLKQKYQVEEYFTAFSWD